MGQLPADVFSDSQTRLLGIITGRQAELDRVQHPQHVAALTEADARRHWNDATDLQRRELARAAITTITINPHPDKASRAFTPDRITYTCN